MWAHLYSQLRPIIQSSHRTMNPRNYPRTRPRTLEIKRMTRGVEEEEEERGLTSPTKGSSQSPPMVTAEFTPLWRRNWSAAAVGKQLGDEIGVWLSFDGTECRKQIQQRRRSFLHRSAHLCVHILQQNLCHPCSIQWSSFDFSIFAPKGHFLY